MKTETISLTTVVDIELTGFGQHLLDKHTDSEAVREFEDNLDGRSFGPRRVALPLWEAFQIFGPHFRSSLKWPLTDLEYKRELSEVEKNERASDRRYGEMADALRTVLVKLDAASNYTAPEQVVDLAAAWSRGESSRVPDGAGQWWLGDAVVRVEWGTGDAREILVVKLGNGRRRPVSDYQSETWGGEAIRDPRVEGLPF